MNIKRRDLQRKSSFLVYIFKFAQQSQKEQRWYVTICIYMEKLWIFFAWRKGILKLSFFHKHLNICMCIWIFLKIEIELRIFWGVLKFQRDFSYKVSFLQNFSFGAFSYTLNLPFQFWLILSKFKEIKYHQTKKSFTGGAPDASRLLALNRYPV